MRVEALGKNVIAYCRETGNGSSTHDLCRDCWLTLQADQHALDHVLEPYEGCPVPEEGWNGDCAHPPYEGDPGHYKCANCGFQLDSRDNGHT